MLHIQDLSDSDFNDTVETTIEELLYVDQSLSDESDRISDEIFDGSCLFERARRDARAIRRVSKQQVIAFFDAKIAGWREDWRLTVEEQTALDHALAEKHKLKLAKAHAKAQRRKEQDAAARADSLIPEINPSLTGAARRDALARQAKIQCKVQRKLKQQRDADRWNAQRLGIPHHSTSHADSSSGSESESNSGDSDDSRESESGSSNSQSGSEGSDSDLTSDISTLR